MFANAFQGKRVLVTGHTGFKGSWISQWLLRLGAEVHGFALPVDPSQRLFSQLQLQNRMTSSYEVDIRDQSSVKDAISQIQPEFVFHLAAQALVRKSYIEPVETFQTNVIGTANVIEALRDLESRCTAVIVTTDKCYENKEWVHAYRETDPLGGHDPYSASKACAEIVAGCYRKSFTHQNSQLRLATARAGNVIGGGDWAEDRIFPDIVRAIRQQEQVQVRNRHATRPWQHVLEPLSGYLWLASQLHQTQNSNLDQLDCFNFGPQLDANRTVEELVVEVLKHLEGDWQDCSDPKAVHEASRLNLTIDKAHHFLGWSPCWDFPTAIEKTSRWYQADRQSQDMLEFTDNQIAEYSSQAQQLKIDWAK